MVKRSRKKEKNKLIGFAFIKIEPVSMIKPSYEYIMKNENIVEIHEVTGEYDLFCKIASSTPDEFRNALDYIRQAKGVKKLDVNISYHQIKPEE